MADYAKAETKAAELAPLYYDGHRRTSLTPRPVGAGWYEIEATYGNTGIDKYQDKGVADLQGMRRAALEKAAAGSEIAEKIAAEIKKVLRVKTKDQDEAIAEERTELRKQVRAAAGKCTDLEKLQAALDILDEGTELSFIDEDFDE